VHVFAKQQRCRADADARVVHYVLVRVDAVIHERPEHATQLNVRPKRVACIVRFGGAEADLGGCVRLGVVLVGWFWGGWEDGSKEGTTYRGQLGTSK
jgi:hypothetical protein